MTEIPMSDEAAKFLMDEVERTGLGALNSVNDIHPDFDTLMVAFVEQSFHPEQVATYLDQYMTPSGVPSERALLTGLDNEEEVFEMPEPEPVPGENGPEFYERPSGEKYYPRPWGKLLTDIEVLRKARDMDRPIFLYGPPGTGKTAMGEAAFGDELITILGTGDTELSDLMGQYIPDPSGNGGYIWQDGPLLVAALSGRPVLVDEIGVINPKVLTGIYSFMDGRREYRVTANPERGVVKAAPGFFVIGATNPNAVGVNISEALLSRFALHVEVTTDYALAKRLGVDERVVSLSMSLNNSMRDGGGASWAPQFRELLVFQDLMDTFGQEFAISNLIASSPEQDRDDLAQTFSKAYGKPYFSAQV